MSAHRVITSPVRLTGSVHPQQLASLVSVDAMIRRSAALGLAPTNWELSTLAGDAAIQRAVRRVVAREGDDKQELGRDGFAARARRLEHDADADLRDLFAALQISPDMDRWSANGDDASEPARIAFVRLYEAGVVTRTDTVVDSCPSCESVVDDADTDIAVIDVEQLRISVPLADGVMEIELSEPELLVGAVAVAIPPGLSVTDSAILLPLTDREVPLVVVEDLLAPTVVVPGHDLWSYELARQLNLPVVEVLDGEGVVRHPGPLEGLGRYAARLAATEQLVAEGFVTAHFTEVQSVKRCYRCGTALVPLFGRHWLLSFRPLVDAAVEAVKSGAVAFAPANAMDHLLTLADQSGDWVISQQLWAGHPIPVASCLDCGQTEVSVEKADSCKSCMGTLEAHTDVLDARFMAAVTPLAMAGWPAATSSADETSTTLLVGKSGLDIWALPIAALGLRLSGHIPFQQLVVHQSPIGVMEPGQQVISDVTAQVATAGVRVMRASLLLGDSDLVRATELVRLLEHPTVSDHRWAGVVERYDKAILAMEASEALAVLTNVAREGVATADLAPLHELTAALLGKSPD